MLPSDHCVYYKYKNLRLALLRLKRKKSAYNLLYNMSNQNCSSETCQCCSSNSDGSMGWFSSSCHATIKMAEDEIQSLRSNLKETQDMLRASEARLEEVNRQVVNNLYILSAFQNGGPYGVMCIMNFIVSGASEAEARAKVLAEFDRITHGLTPVQHNRSRELIEHGALRLVEGGVACVANNPDKLEKYPSTVDDQKEMLDSLGNEIFEDVFYWY